MNNQTTQLIEQLKDKLVKASDELIIRMIQEARDEALVEAKGAAAKSTDAAKLALSELNVAAVASRQAAVKWGLNVLAHSIEDSPFNETRFAVIGPSDSAKTGNDKTAMMFQISHSPGSLADVLAIFKGNKLNLTWIESFPYPEAKGEYVFFIDFDGHRDDPKVKKTIASMEETCEVTSILGSFPRHTAANE